MEKAKKLAYLEWTLWILALIPLVATLILYPSLPEKIPMHWNARGEIDGWGGRNSAFLLPLIILGLSLLLKFIPKIDPHKKNYASFEGPYALIRLGFVVFMGVIQAAILRSAFDAQAVKVDFLISLSMGALFALLGYAMPKFRHNYFVGIRTPWTLANETVWKKTHQLGGRIWLAGGLVMIVSAALLKDTLLVGILMGMILVMVLVPVIYSYIVFRQEDSKTQQ
ncbi:MAG TPA: hypothetical protein DD727_03610 [Clostridiales bacterium]|nr:hypothetical protein [Clostridiales bacterium]